MINENSYTSTRHITNNSNIIEVDCDINRKKQSYSMWDFYHSGEEDSVSIASHTNKRLPQSSAMSRIDKLFSELRL